MIYVGPALHLAGGLDKLVIAALDLSIYEFLRSIMRVDGCCWIPEGGLARRLTAELCRDLFFLPPTPTIFLTERKLHEEFAIFDRMVAEPRNKIAGLLHASPATIFTYIEY